MDTGQVELKALKCATCGGDLVKSHRSEYDDEEEERVSVPVAKCSSCGKEYDRKTDEYYGVFAGDLTSDRDATVFRLGAKGVIGGVEYEIIGRLRYQDEDEWEKSTWDEWFAVSAEGGYHYFVEEEGEIHSYEDYTPQSIDLESNPGHIEFEGRRISQNDSYTGRIVLAEGELPWKPTIGESAVMYDFKKDGVRYTIERSGEEITVTRGEKLAYNDVIAAFGGEKEKALYHRTAGRRRTYRRKAVIYSICAVISFLATAVSCLSTSPVEGVMKNRMVLDDNEAIAEAGQSMYQSGVLFGPFELPDAGVLYNVKVSVNEAAGDFNLEWQSFRLMLVPEERLLKSVDPRGGQAAVRALFDEIDALREPLECYAMSGDFWDEEGHDDEGYWHESDLSSDDDFVLEKPGNYYAFMELTSQKPRPMASVEIRIERVRSYRYFLMSAAVFIGFAFINRARARSYNEMPFAVAPE